MTAAQQQKVLAAVYVELTNAQATADQATVEMAKVIAKHLRKAGKKGIVVTDLPSIEAHRVCLAINEKIGSVVIDTKHTTITRQGNALEVSQLVEDLNSGAVQGIIMADVNPV